MAMFECNLNSNLGIVRGKVNVSTTNSTVISLGFKPSLLVVTQVEPDGYSLINTYSDKDSNSVSRYVPGYTAQERYNLPTSNLNRINSINNDGFIFGAVNEPGTVIEYIAVKKQLV